MGYPPPPLPPQTQQARNPWMYSQMLGRLRQKLAQESSNTWSLVWVVGGLTWVGMLWGIFMTLMDSGASAFSRNPFEPFAVIPGLISLASGAGGVFVVVFAYRNYHAIYRDAASHLYRTDVALMLVDESYGRMIEEWRREKYKVAFAEVPPGKDFATRFNHFAYYFHQYLAMARGSREFPVTPASQLSCMVDGLAMWFCASASCGIVPIVVCIRVATIYPRILAIKRATLDFLEDRLQAPHAGDP